MKPTLTLCLTVEFLDEVHLGAGAGHGEGIDSALQRDADGEIRLDGARAKGRLRQAIRLLIKEQRLLAALDQRLCSGPPEYKEGCPCCLLLGDAERTGWQVRSARRMGAPPRAALGSMRPGREAGSPVTRTAVDPRRGRAEDAKLFTREHGRAGLVFEVACETARPPAHALAEAALLAAAASWKLPALGAGTSRGLGRCRITAAATFTEPMANDAGEPVGPYTHEALIDLFAEAWLGDAPACQVSGLSTEHSTPRSQTFDDAPIRAALVIEALEPLLFPSRPDAGNEYESLPFIPGPSLWGAFAANAADERAVPGLLDAVLSGKVTVTPAYPARVAEHAREPWTVQPEAVPSILPSIPTPLDLLGCKLTRGWVPTSMHGVANAAKDPLDSLLTSCLQCAAPSAQSDVAPESSGEEREDTEQQNGSAQPIARPGVALTAAGGFVPVGGGASWEPVRAGEVHIGMDYDRGAGKPGELFSTSVLPRGTYFVAEIHAPEQALQAFGLGEVDSAITMTLGKRGSSGYGRVQVYRAPWPAGAESLLCPPALPNRLGWAVPSNGATGTNGAEDDDDWEYEDDELTDDEIEELSAQDAVSEGEADAQTDAESLTVVDAPAPTEMTLTLTLLTPLVARDRWGRYLTGLDESWLATLLDQHGIPPSKLIPLGIFSRGEVVQGFNQKTGLPRRGITAVRAGSAIGFTATWDQTRTEVAKGLQAIEATRHGDRTAEGFGLVRLNHPAYTRTPEVEAGVTASGTGNVPPDLRDLWYWQHEAPTISEAVRTAIQDVRCHLARASRVHNQRAALARVVYRAATIPLPSPLPDNASTAVAFRSGEVNRQLTMLFPAPKSPDTPFDLDQRGMEKRVPRGREREAVTAIAAAIAKALGEAGGTARDDGTARAILTAVADAIAALPDQLSAEGCD
jgi:CRISPR/Cas system CSM-associated protein Csm3 (group 7 of RAMP superfamily)